MFRAPPKETYKIHFANSIESHVNVCLEKDYSPEQIFLIGYETPNYVHQKEWAKSGI